MRTTSQVSGLPVVEASRKLSGVGGLVARPTGDATTASSTAWTATATGSGTAHTKGSWTEVVAATTFEIYGLMVLVSGAGTALSNTNSSALLDIGVGAAASEEVRVADIAAGYRFNFATEPGRPNPVIANVPVYIPVGSRIAIRCQGAETSKSVPVIIVPLARSTGAPVPSTKVVTIGADAASSAGTVVTAPGSTNTKGAWTELTSATTESFRGLMLGIQAGSDTSMANATGLLDIAIGSSGNEVTVLSNIHMGFSSSENLTVLNIGAFDLAIPKGTRISARYQLSALGNSLDVILYGIR